MTFLAEGKVDLTEAHYPAFCKRLTDFIVANRDYALLAYRSTTFFQYYNLADAKNEKKFVSGYGPCNLHDTELAREALAAAGAAAVADILRVYAEITDDYARSDLAAVLMKINDARAKPVVLGDLLGNKLRGSDTEAIRKWCIRDIKKEVDSVFRTSAKKDLRQKLSGLLIALEAEGNGRTAIFCECGYPVRVRYRDRSEGPINALCKIECPEQYTNTYSCGNCGKFVYQITQ